MRNFLKTLAVIALMIVAGATQAQTASKSKTAQIDIHSNPVCGECKRTIETEMLYVKGVHSVTVDLEAKVIHVGYNPKKTGPEKLREAVSKIGYEADGLAPDMKARKALPACCQLDDHNDHPSAEPAEPAAPAAPAHQE
ncbi:MAG TPA: heavy metal-associated domain-containing protein [Flavobacteriales bacterium]|nr:heavy metal-associated domain-containing protein [Flavobacteriales bacterium]